MRSHGRGKRPSEEISHRRFAWQQRRAGRCSTPTLAEDLQLPAVDIGCFPGLMKNERFKTEAVRLWPRAGQARRGQRGVAACHPRGASSADAADAPAMEVKARVEIGVTTRWIPLLAHQRSFAVAPSVGSRARRALEEQKDHIARARSQKRRRRTGGRVEPRYRAPAHRARRSCRSRPAQKDQLESRASSFRVTVARPATPPRFLRLLENHTQSAFNDAVRHLPLSPHREEERSAISLGSFTYRAHA